MFRKSTLIYSLAIHALFVALVLQSPSQPIPAEPRILLEISSSKNQPERKSRSFKKSRFDLRPEFSKHGLFAAPVAAPTQAASSPSFGEELLHVNPKVIRIFDGLAHKINRHLDYPEILAENDIHGIATLDLYFDELGRINEQKSRFHGNHRSLRGLLVQATRLGLLDWYQSDASKISAHEFKNQHFQADFVISSFLGSASGLSQGIDGSYRFLRRRNSQPCLMGALDGSPALDVTCIGFKIAGSLKRAFVKGYQSRLRGLMDRLEYFDSIELRGIRGQTHPGA